MEFRDAVKYLRNELGFTQIDLANALHVTTVTIGRWENGRNLPNRVVTAAIMSFAQEKGVSHECLSILKSSIANAAKAKFNASGDILFSVEHASLRQLIDDASFPIYVCDIETDEILYLNQKALAMVGGDEPVIGKRCYECLMYRNAPCEFCHKSELVEDRFTCYEAQRSFDGAIYKVQGKKIKWNGREAHVRYMNEPDVNNRLKNIIDNMNGGVSVAVYGNDGKVRLAYANNQYYALFGYTKEQFVSELKDPHATLHPEDCDSVNDAIAQVKSTGKPATFRYRIIRRDGSIAFISCNSSLSEVPGLEDKVLISVLTDVTASVEAEQQALVTGQRLSAIMGHISSGVMANLLHDDGRVDYVLVSEQYYEIFGYTQEQYRQEVPNPFDLVYEEDAKTVRREVAAMRAPGESKTLKYRAMRRDGRVIWIKADISIIRFADVHMPVLLSVFEDITATVESEEQLRARDARMTKLMNEMPGGLAVVEANWLDVPGTLRIVNYNDSFFRFSGCTREEYAAHLRKAPMGFLFDEDVASVIDVAEQACHGEIGVTVSCTVRCHTKGGGYRWLLLTGKLVDRQDDICTINIVLVDTTSKKEAEDQQRISEEMLRIAAETDKRAIIVYDVKANACHVESRNLFCAKYRETIENIPQSLIELGIAEQDSIDELDSLFDTIRSGKEQITVSLHLRTGPAEYQWFECNASVVFDAEGKPDHAVLVFHNVTEQRIKEAVFKKWQQSIASRPPESYTLFRSNLSKDSSLDERDGDLIKVKFDTKSMAFNDRTREYAEQFVYPDDREAYSALLDSDNLLSMFYRGEHSAILEYREIDESGNENWRKLTVEMVEYLNSTDVQAFLMYENIDAEKKTALKEQELAETDPLTGVLNRTAFVEKAEMALAANPSAQQALLMLDMDGFKQVNDTFGHAVGDQALMDIAAVIRSLLDDGDLICRLGGDEFLIFLHDSPYDAVIEKRAKTICEMTRKAFSQAVQISTSIGIAVFPRDGQNFDELYHKADKALYYVKNAGKDNFALYSASDTSHIEGETDGLPPDPGIHRAVSSIKRKMLIVDDNEANRITLHSVFKDDFQVELARNGAEAMIRLRHLGSSIAIVLLDLEMPGMNGYEVLQRMQNNVELRTIPVIVVSGDDDVQSSLKAIELGAAEFVTKPVDFNLIRIRVKSAISKADNERLRAQNSYLQLQRDEELKFRTVLDSTGTVVVEYDWRNHVFIYDNTISKYIAGNYNNLSIWSVFLTDMVADSTDVKVMQDMLHSLAADRERKQASILVQLKTPQKVKHWFRMNIYKQVDDFGLAEKMIITFNDVHEEILANEKLKYQATRDELTGLYNRAGFIERAAELIAAKEPGYYVLSSIDIEKFKVINDQYGTQKGDEVLCELARIVCDTLKNSDSICCHVVADIFAMLYPKSLLQTEKLVGLHRACEVLDGSLPRLRIYIGRCVVDDKSLNVSALLDRATMAKETVKGRYDKYIATYDESMRTGILNQQKIIGQMNHALSSGQFEVWLQPQFNHSSGLLCGAEALVRWRHPEDGLIPPGEFIPIFERNGFVYELDKYVWEQVCILLRKWLDQGFCPVPVSVNISRYDVFRGDLIGVITKLVEQYDLPFDLLRLEITESAFAESTDQIIRVVSKLVELGFTVEIDDFGSGYSSLNTLKDVPAQVIKMDMRFLENDTNAQRGGSIIESVVRMARWLGMDLIAEGVETVEQADYLKAIGCTCIQGYLYSRPTQVTEYEELFADGKTESMHGVLNAVETWNNNAFWNPTSMETLIFNSYIGGACIFEYHNGAAELLRYNAGYAEIFGGSSPYNYADAHKNILSVLDGENAEVCRKAVEAAVSTKKEVPFEISLAGNGDTTPMYIRATVRQIAESGDRYLLYCVVYDMTQQRVSEQKRQEAERLQIESAQQLEIIMGNINGGVAALKISNDGHSEFIFSNKRYFEIFGYSVEQARNERLDVMSLILPEDSPAVIEKINRLKANKTPVSIDYRCKRRDGKLIYVRENCAIMRMDKHGEVITSMLMDITEERELNDKFRAVVDNINGGVSATYLREGKPEYVIVNDRYYDIIGYTKEQFEAEVSNVFDLVHPDDRARIESQFTEAVSHQGQYTMEYRFIRRDGEVRNILCNTNVLHLFGVDEPVQLAVSNDITELRKAQNEAIEASAKLRAVMQHAGDGITAIALHENAPEFIFVNDRYFETIGYSRDAYRQMTADDLFAPICEEDRERVRQLVTNANASSGTTTVEYRVRQMNGSIVWIRSVVTITELAGFDCPVQIAVFSDITKQKKAEELQKEILDNLPNGTALFEFDGETMSAIHINKRYWQLVEREPVAYYRTSVLGVIHPDDLIIVNQEIAASIRQRRDLSVHLRIRCGQSAYKTFHVAATITPEADGKYLFYASYTPISEESMSVQEMIPIALSTMMSASSNISYVKDKDMRYICCSRSLVELLGLENERDVIGKSAHELFASEDADRFDADDRAVIRSGQSVVDIREYIHTAEHEARLMQTSKYPILDAFGHVVGVYCLSIDITSQREKESQLELLTSSIPGGLAAYLLTDKGPRILFFNDGFYAFSGCTREEYAKAAEESAFAFVFDEDKPIIEAVVKDYMEHKVDGRAGECVFRCHTKSGEYRWLSMKTVLSQVGDDRFVINAVLLDITEQKEVENRQKELLDNLPCGAALYTFDGKRISAVHINRQYMKMTGRHFNSISTSQSPMDFIHPDDRQIVMNEIVDAIKCNREAACDIRVLYSSDAYRAFRVHAHITAQSDGTYSLYVTYSEISETELTFRETVPFIFSTIMESSTDLAFAKDRNFRYICCSKSFAEFLGLGSEETVIGKTDYELFSKEIADRFRKDDSRLIATGDPIIDLVESIPTPDGRLNYTRMSKHLLRNTAGEVIGLYGSGRDITESKEAYEQLKLMTNSIPGGLATFACSPKGIRLTYCNDGFCKLFDIPRESYDSASFGNPIHYVVEADRPILTEQYHAMMSGGTPIDCIYRICAKDGNHRWIHHRALISDRHNDVVFVNAALFDITTQQDEKEQLALHEEEYRLATEHSGRIICRYNIADRSVTITTEAAKRLGLPKRLEDVPYGRVKQGFVSSDTADAYIAFYEAIIHGEKEKTAVFQKLLPSGWRWLSAHAATIFADNGTPVSAIVTYEDVTEEQEKEAAFSKWNQALQNRRDETYTLFRSNLNKDASLDTREGALLAHWVSDDAAKSFNERTLDFASKWVAAEDRDTYTRFVNSDAMLAGYHKGKRADALDFRAIMPSGEIHWLRLSVELVGVPHSTDVEAYMMYENIDEQKQSELILRQMAETDPLTGLLNRKAFSESVNARIQELGSKAQHAFFMLDIDGFKLLNDTFGHAAGDEALIEVARKLQALLRHGDLLGRLGGDEFVVFLENIPGKGNVEKKAKQICAALYKAYNPEVSISVSIGVSLYPQDGTDCHSLYENADMALYTAKENGRNTFAFYHNAMSERRMTTEIEHGSHAEKPAKTQVKRRMLIVDDNALDRKALANLFEKEFIVDFALDGASALTRMRYYGSALSIVLLDLFMQGMTGFDVLERARKSPEMHNIPIIVVSADDDRETSLRAIRAGATDFISKPVEPELIRLRVDAAISHTENERLRAQNSHLEFLGNTTERYQAALSELGMAVIELDWIKGSFTYDSSISQFMKGNYDERSLWRIFMSDMVADAMDVQKLQAFVHDFADDRNRHGDSMRMRLRTPSNATHWFSIHVIKLANDAGLTQKLVLMFQDTDAGLK